MKRELKWELVPEGTVSFEDNPLNDAYYRRDFPAAPKTTIDDTHPQEGLFPPHFDEYMQYWPEHIVHPVSIVILNNVWEENSYKDWETGVVETEWERGPLTVLTMPNGATMTVAELDPWGDESPAVTLEGNWSEYAPEDSEDIGFIEDVIVEAYELSDMSEEELTALRERNKEHGF